MLDTPTPENRDRMMRTALRATRLFGTWPEGHLARLMALSRLEHCQRGFELSTGTQKSREIVVVVSGCLEISSVNAEGRRHVMTLLGPGESSGLLRVLDAPVMPTSYRAVSDSNIIRVPCPALSALLDEQPILWKDLAMVALSRHYAGVRARHHRATGSRPAQLAEMLLELHARQGRPLKADGMPQPLLLSQLEIAHLLGVSRQTAHKAIHALAQMKMIELQYGHIAIINLAALRELLT